jgi:1-Cys peroxiredoxin 6
MNLGDAIKDFEAETTLGKIKLYDYLGQAWLPLGKYIQGVIFALPADYDAVATTEVAALTKLAEEFQKRNVKVLVLSGDSLETHQGWLKDVAAYDSAAQNVPFPIVADQQKVLAQQLKVVEEGAVLILGTDKKLKLSMRYPATTGRNIDEILRVIDSLQLTASRCLATPANWKSVCIIVCSAPLLANKKNPRCFQWA